jgi:hypothetical protein
MEDAQRIALALDNIHKAGGLIRQRFIGEAVAALASTDLDDRGWYRRDSTGRWTAVGLPKGGFISRETSVAVVFLLIISALVLVAWLRCFDADLY